MEKNIVEKEVNYMEPMKLDIQLFAPDVAYPSDFVFKFVGVENPPSQMDITFYQRYDTSLDPKTITVNFVNGENSGTYNVAFPLRKIVIGDGTLYSATWEECVNAVTTVYIYSNDTFTGKILNDNVDNITPNSGYTVNYNPDFSQVATTDEGMFTAEDSDGISTYFRGAVTNNYVKFANFWWRIIRVNGNGSVRLIYDGTTAHANGESSADRQIGTSAFNTNFKDNAYVGYMYGTPGSTTYEETHANANNSEIKTILDNWYESNLSNYTNYIDIGAGFWGDRTPYSGSGTGTTNTDYAAYNRLYTNKTPSFECTNNSDLYTTTGSEDGNKALQYPIGLISADEVAYAGGVCNTGNSSYYLYTNGTYWTMSPSYFSGSNASVFRVNSSGYPNNYIVNGAYGVRPVINLRGDLFVTGTGTSMDPYEVSLPAVPTTNFNGTELTDIYYNGTEISKMYCNGVLVFEKGPSVVYKRRIMVGDDLKGMTVYNDFYSGYYNNFTKPTGGAIVLPMKLVTVNYETTGMAGDLSGISCYEGSGTITINSDFLEAELYYYNWNTSVERIGGTLTYPTDKDYLVTEVYDIDKSYRHLYIEDPNIRPIQVGDKIIEGTQLYFNFPDNPDSWLTDKYGCDVIKCGDKTIMYYVTEQPVSRATPAISSISLESNDMYAFDLSTLEISKNLSSYIIKFYYQDAVSYVDDKFQQYILVDTTTLGA